MGVVGRRRMGAARVGGARMWEVDVGWGLGVVALRFDQAGLEVDYVVS